MTRVLVTGNSFSLPLIEFFKTASREELGPIELETFVAPYRIYKFFSFSENSQFGALNSSRISDDDFRIIDQINGRRFVDLEVFDKIVFIGADIGHEEIAQTLAAHDVINLFENGRNDRISIELFDAILNSLVQKYTLNCFWSGFPNDRLIFVERARRSSVCLEHQQPANRFFATMGKLDSSCQPAFSRFQDRLQAAFSAQQTVFVRQPEKTIDKTGLTDGTFSRGVPKLGYEGEFPVHDAMHMNGHCGRVIWPDILANLI